MKFIYRAEELPGLKTGNITVIGPTEKVDGRGRPFWRCLCSCGKERVYAQPYVQNGGAKSCGCTRKTRRIKPHVGEVYGELTVLRFHERGGNGSCHLWECLCSCGGRRVYSLQRLRAGTAVDCGSTVHNKCPSHGGVPGWYFRTVEKHAATRKGAKAEFSITIKQAWELFVRQEGLCALTKAPITLELKAVKRKAQTASLDRVDSSVGYTQTNCQWVHKAVNSVKSDFNQDYFVTLCKAVAEHQGRELSMVGSYSGEEDTHS